ncbi:MAG: hypothetical protein U0166_01770 [Acidobacteriota bacterium]
MAPSPSRLARCLVLACSAVAAADGVPDAMLQGLEWRLVGPFRGGWGTMAVGIPGRPNIYYTGTAGGGVWRTTDGGVTWQAIWDDVPASAVGAIALAPSNPDVIYVGTGHPEPRYDIAAGNGMYRSTDGGKSFTHAGLEATRHIGAIVVDPRDASIALVAAVGHFFGPNRERGVFRTTDGGTSWTQPLFIDADTGVVDLAADPVDPRIVLAASWTARTRPWLSYFTPLEGAGSGIHRSTDGGVTWERLAGNGWPDGNLGRIGLGVAHAGGDTRVYATVGGAAGGLYRSDDRGARWQRVNDNAGFGSWYFARITVAPSDPDTLWVMGRSLSKSTDGGKTFTIVKGAPGGDDYHHLWIDPKDPDRMVTASDQGTVVTENGGKSWSSWYNQPTGQFYHLGADDLFPYGIYAGQQDSGTVRVASRSDYGGLTLRDWHPVGADERDDDLPVPADPGIVFGSGLGGRLSRWDARNGEVQNVAPWPVSTYGQRPTTVRYHYTWITPLTISPRAPHAIYLGAQVLFRSTDQGLHWDAISPDLSGKRDGAGPCDGDLAPVAAHDCGYGVVFSIAVSPRSDDEIWVGTDAGDVQMTLDAGRSWARVTPPALPVWGKVSSVDLSPLDPGTAYVAVDNHRQDDFGPHAFRTHDHGKTWTEIGHGMPKGDFVSVVRCDPVRRGLLYAGTDSSVLVSFDDGDRWQPLRLNLPTAQVRDLLVHGDDLIAATQGRALWVLDDVAPLREAGAPIAREAAHLFRPADAIRVRGNQNRDTPLPPEEPVAKNPPAGAIIDYWLAAPAKGTVAIEIRAADGRLVRRFASDDPPRATEPGRYFAGEWLKPPGPLPATAGAHRIAWDLRHPRPRALGYDYSIAAVRGVDTPLLPQGPLVLSGDYEVALVVDGKRLRAPLRVRPDPRIPEDPAAAQAALAFDLAVEDGLDRAFVLQGQLAAATRQAASQERRLGGDTTFCDALAAFSRSTALLSPGDGEEAPGVGTIGGVLGALATDAEATDRTPTEPQQEVLALYTARLQSLTGTWRAIQAADLASLNATLRAAGLAEIRVPGADELGAPASDESEDVP